MSLLVIPSFNGDAASSFHRVLSLRGGWRADTAETWGRGSLEGYEDSPTRAGEVGFPPRHFAHRIESAELTSIQEALDKKYRTVVESEIIRRPREVIIIPDDEDNVVHGVLRAVKSKYKVFVKPGTHSWRGFIPLPFKSTMHLFAAGEDSTFQVEDRKVAGKVTLVGRWVFEPTSQGSFLNLTLSWRKGTESRPTEEGEAADTFRSCLLIYGSPWLIENCECLSSGGVSMAVCGFGQATCRSCRMGGIEKEFPASCALFVNQGAKLLFKSSVAKYSAFGLYMDGAGRCVVGGSEFVCNFRGVCLRGNAKVALWSSSMKQNMQSSLRVFANEYTDVELEDLESTDGKLWEDNNRPRRLVEKTVRWQPCEEVKSLLVDMYARMSEMSVTPPCLSHSSTGLKKEEVLELCDEESIEEMKKAEQVQQSEYLLNIGFASKDATEQARLTKIMNNFARLDSPDSASSHVSTTSLSEDEQGGVDRGKRSRSKSLSRSRERPKYARTEPSLSASRFHHRTFGHVSLPSSSIEREPRSRREEEQEEQAGRRWRLEEGTSGGGGRSSSVHGQERYLHSRGEDRGRGGRASVGRRGGGGRGGRGGGWERGVRSWEEEEVEQRSWRRPEGPRDRRGRDYYGWEEERRTSWKGDGWEQSRVEGWGRREGRMEREDWERRKYGVWARRDWERRREEEERGRRRGDGDWEGRREGEDGERRETADRGRSALEEEEGRSRRQEGIGRAGGQGGGGTRGYSTAGGRIEEKDEGRRRAGVNSWFGASGEGWKEDMGSMLKDDGGRRRRMTVSAEQYPSLGARRDTEANLSQGREGRRGGGEGSWEERRREGRGEGELGSVSSSRRYQEGANKALVAVSMERSAPESTAFTGGEERTNSFDDNSPSLAVTDLKRLHEENEALRKQIMIISDEKRLVPQKYERSEDVEPAFARWEDVVVSWSRKKFDLDAAINHFAELEAAGKKIGSIWEHIVKMVLRGELNRGRSEEMKKELISAGIPLFAQNKQPEQDTYDIGKCTTLSNINGAGDALESDDVIPARDEQASMRDLRKFANNTDKLVLYPTVERLPGESLADRKNEYLREARKKLLSACHPTPPSNKEVLELAMKMKAKSDQERGLYYRKVDDRDDNYKLDDYELMKRYLYQNLFKDRSGEYNF